MFPEVARILDSDDVHLVIWVVITQVCHYVQLDLCLVFKLLLVPDDLHSDELTGFVILAFNRLTEAALPQEIKHFKPKRQVIPQDHGVIALVVIIAIVVILAGLALYFGLSCYRTQKVNHFIVQNLSLLIVGHAARL